MTTLVRLAIVTAGFLTLPAAVILAGPRLGLAGFEAMVFAALTIPASGVVAVCIAASFHRADRAISAAKNIRLDDTEPGETR